MKFRIVAMLAAMLIIFDASAKVKKTKKENKETTEQQAAPSQITIKGKSGFQNSIIDIFIQSSI